MLKPIRNRCMTFKTYILPLCIPMVMMGCGGSDGGHALTLPTQKFGVYSVTTSDPQASTGIAFHANDQRAFIALSKDGDTSTQVIYVRDNHGNSRRVPASDSKSAESELTYSNYRSITTTQPVAGIYDARVGDKTIQINLDVNGKLATISEGDCKITGAVNSDQIYGPKTATISFQAQGCIGISSGRFTGIAFSLQDEPEKTIHMIGENGQNTLDILGWR